MGHDRGTEEEQYLLLLNLYSKKETSRKRLREINSEGEV